tara:strand:- start:3568 stop:4212 length:645 start_codon:yes stop_codon:yes gene_type:complete
MINNELSKRIISSLIIIPVALFFIIKGSFLFTFFILICFLISSYEWHKMSNKKPYYLPGLLFLILSFYSAYIIRANDNNSLELFLYILIVCVSTDIGGYIFGKVFKGPKLIKISPKKTYTGVIGGYLMSIILYFLFKNFNYGAEINSNDFIFILLISTISQLGDITISYFKRLSKIKDTGKILPGHGGLLDRIDGMIFAFPVAYIIFKIIQINF